MIHLVSPHLRRTAALVATTALLATALVGCGEEGDRAETASESHESSGRPFAHDAADWLVQEELQGGLVVNDEFGTPDHGATVDAIYALQAIEYDDAAITEMTDAVTAAAEEYVTPKGAVWAGNAGKVVTLVTDSGGDPSDVGGFDALATLEARTAESGRTSDKSEFGDYANSLGQAWAVQGLMNADSPEADAALDYLLMQQCEDGFLRQAFSEPKAKDQSCDGAGDSASTDATALFVVLMHDEAEGDDELASAVAAASDHLVATQADDGSFAGGTQVPANANSTGLAGWALQLAGEDEAAADAAEWVRSHQLPECEGAVADEAGAIAYDDAALAAAGSKGLTKKTSHQWRLATAQAMPALLAAPEDAAAAECPAAT